ncbi:hypothetical protein PHJA_002008700 [Phtheirospermum japonicum]|uniref:Uncharacterized protein n=1 Tax=Phtheirospermum japonicum TaxID=374723 RepID=A0A830CMS8_9LAMI|nr:hypothetical protein PHJA_002008700 [Phtheirospermum japonicum]
MASTIVNTVLLKDEKLRQLAQLIRNHEINNLYHITFQNLGDQLQYLRMCNDNMASVNTILDDCNALVIRYKGNYTLRRSYLDKMMDHHNQLFQALEELDTANGGAAADLTESVQEFDQMVMSYMRLSLNPHAFCRILKISQEHWHRLQRTGSKTKLGYKGRFEDLEEEQKLEVYASIIEASGRLSVLSKDEGDIIKAKGRMKLLKYGSTALRIIDVGQIIWETFSSDHPITTATREALVLAANIGGAAIGKLVGVAVATHLTGQAATTLFITAVGVATGFVGGFILGLAAGILFDLIIGSGGENPLPTDGLIVYVAPMPNGHELAKQII